MREFTSLIVLALALVTMACDGPNASVGGACDDNFDCHDRCIDEWPGGFCTLECRDNRDCPSDSVCVDSKGGVCMLLCKSSSECKDWLGDSDYSCHVREDVHEDDWDVCVGT